MSRGAGTSSPPRPRREPAPAVAPPPAWRWAYRLLGARLPAQHRGWAAADVRSRSGLRRAMLARLPVSLLGIGVLALVLLTDPEGGLDAGAGGLLGAALGMTLGTAFAGERQRRQLLRWQHVDVLGHPVEPGRWQRATNAEALVASVGALVLLSGLLSLLVR